MTYSVRPQPTGETKLQGLAKRKLYGAIASVLVLAVAGGAALKLTTATSNRGDVAADGVANSEVQPDGTTALQEPLVPITGEGATPFQSQPFLAASGPLRLADPSLLRSTSSQARVESVTAGRPDPFASVVLPAPARPRSNPAASLLTPAPPAIATQNLPMVPVGATQALPPLPQAAVQPVALPNLPAPFLPGAVPPNPTEIAVAPTGAPAFQNLVDQVVVTGVVQVGSSVSLIVTEPGSTVGRRVSQGDMLAAGRIRVKSVDLSGQEPMVVLTYDGQDYTRSVGAALVSAL
jgi:hypothetical protein